MAKTIHKYQLKLGGVLSIPIPEEAKVLHFDNQYNAPVIWVELDASDQTVSRNFLVTGTGIELPAADLEYIGTAIFNSGSLILHLYEEL